MSVDETIIRTEDSEASTRKPRARKAKAAPKNEEQRARARAERLELELQVLRAIEVDDEATAAEVGEACAMTEEDAQGILDELLARGVVRESRISTPPGQPRFAWYVVEGDDRSRILRAVKRAGGATASWLAEEACVAYRRAADLCATLAKAGVLVATDEAVGGETVYEPKAETQEQPADVGQHVLDCFAKSGPRTLDQVAKETGHSRHALRGVVVGLLTADKIHERAPVEPGPVLFALGPAPAEPARPAPSDVDGLADWLCTDEGKRLVPHRLAPAGARAVVKLLEGEQRLLAWVASHPREIEALLTGAGFKPGSVSTYANNTVRAARCRLAEQATLEATSHDVRIALDELQPVLQAAGEVGRELEAMRAKVAVLEGHLAQLFAFAKGAK